MKERLSKAGYWLHPHTRVWSRPDYSGITYSDGEEVEQRLAAIIEQAGDISVLSAELRARATDWPSLYHLSGARANLLRPFQRALEAAEVLEIGAGCGAITRYLGECGATVLALEGSLSRSAITRLRTRDLHNVFVISERFDEFHWDQQFDVITLIGVLEYANLFTPGEHPALAMLKRVRSMLRPHGTIILAIENQLGLKYFAGAPEDHLGQPMYGLEERYRHDQPQTYGRKVLTEILQQAGFAHVECMAPFPDYKLPASIVTERGFANKKFDAGALAWQSVRRDPQLPPILGFSPELVWPVLAQNAIALDLSNSFLMVAGGPSARTTDASILAWHFTSERSKEFCKETQFVQTGNDSIEVRYHPLSPGSTREIRGQQLTFVIPEHTEYVQGKPSSQEFIHIVSRDGWRMEEVGAFLQRYLGMLASAHPAHPTHPSFGKSLLIQSADTGLPGDRFDVLPQNIIVKPDGSWEIIDKEWRLNQDIEAGWLIFRALLPLIHSVTRFGAPASGFGNTPLGFFKAAFQSIDLAVTDEHLELYAKQEVELQSVVVRRPLDENGFLRWMRTAALPCHNLNQALIARDGQIEDLHQLMAEGERKIAGLSLDLDEQKRMNAECLNNLYSRLLTKEGELRHAVGQLEAIHSSVMWRVALRVRKLRDRLFPEGSLRGSLYARLLPWLKGEVHYPARKEQSTGGALEKMLARANAILPGSPHRKYQIRSYIFRRYGSLFAHTESYQRWKERQPPVLPDSVSPPEFPPGSPREPLPLVQVGEHGVRALVRSFNFSLAEQPLVSVIIAVHNHLDYTVCCLASLLKHGPRTSYEVIIVDDASQDETPNILPTIKNIQYRRNETNLGFLQSSNKGAGSARGRFLLFLNNDTQVLEGWLDELVNTFQQFSNVGLVGSKLIFPNGRLQEAGAILKPDGSAELVGLQADANRPEYNVVREVDYCSGACLLIEAEVFKTLGGFDEAFSPCYCEDSDLALRVRKMGKRVLYQPRSVVVHHLSVSIQDSEHSKSALVERNTGIFVQRWGDELKKLNEVRAIAFYLPQYHPIPENDQWWGKGFTEWANVTKARPNFQGHYQPHLPADLGFYDLRVPEVREEQARLARQYGISAFCYYYYWFAGKKLLNRPLDEVVESGRPDFPFCICWANENWTRRWDGCEEDILMAQSHTDEDHANFIAGIAPVLRDPRYVKIDGKPLVVVYRLSLMPEPKRTADVWREYCMNEGIGEIYLAYVQSFDRVPQGDDPAVYGFDAAIEFPPHRYPVRAETLPPLINHDYQGVLYDYKATSENFITRSWPSYKLFKTVMPSWDNTPRRQDVSHVFVNATPEGYQHWLRKIVEQTRRLHFGEERLVFINAWNEWAEGNHLEPDRQFGHQYLVATKQALGISDST